MRTSFPSFPSQGRLTRVKSSKHLSIECEQFADLKTCLRELTIMNEHYNIFKKSNQNIKSKSKKFFNFYKNNRGNDLIFPNPVSEETKLVKKLLSESVNPPKFKSEARLDLDARMHNVIGVLLPEGVDPVKQKEVELLCPSAPPRAKEVSVFSMLWYDIRKYENSWNYNDFGGSGYEALV